MRLYIWRHPKPTNAKGVCLGQSNMGVDKRKLKRLANRIESYVKKHQLPKVIWVSDLQRSQGVGVLLAQRGFECYIDSRVAEINFGDWDGKYWQDISKQEIDAWCNNFAHFAPANGESLTQLFARVQAWLMERMTESNSIQQLDNNKTCQLTQSSESQKPLLAVGHAGWINAATMISHHGADSINRVNSMTWAMPVAYDELTVLDFDCE